MNQIIKRITKKIFYKISFFLENYYEKNQFSLTDGVLATTDQYIKLFNETKNKENLSINDYIKKKNINIDREWIDDLALVTQIVIKKNSLNYSHGLLLYAALTDLVKNSDLNKITILETGTARGFSSLCMAKALFDQNKKGNIFSIDILPSNKKMYWNCLLDNDGKKTRYELLSKWSNLVDEYLTFLNGYSTLVLKKLELKRINFAFLDGSHDYNTVKFEADFVAQKQLKDDVIVYDDYNNEQYPGLVEACNEISKKYNYKNFFFEGENNRNYLIAKKQ